MQSRRLSQVGLALGHSMLLVACASSSHVLVGKAHPAISPADVAVYTQAPEFFEEIAQIKASSGASLRSAEEKNEQAIDALRREAARLGANAIVLQEDENEGEEDTVAYSRTTETKGTQAPDGSEGQSTTVAVASSDNVLAKTVRGLAIYVPE